jgi:hypothetical protein
MTSTRAPGGHAAAQVVQEFGGDALAGDDHRNAGVRMLPPGRFHLLRRRRVSQLQPFVVPGPDPLRLHPAEDQPGHHRLVRVAADQQVSASSRGAAE